MLKGGRLRDAYRDDPPQRFTFLSVQKQGGAGLLQGPHTLAEDG